MIYRSEIDGLRALAVVPIILYHADFNLFSGGFVGVDIFFVISGYLITTIIYQEIQDKNFSLIAFYERWARRILHPLFFVMAITVPFAWLVLSPYDLVSFSKSFTAVSLFISNIFFWRDGDYFETAAELKPLIHTWSLAVEEQFYLGFPLLLLFASKYGKAFIIKCILIAVILSLFIAQVGSLTRPVATFFLLPTRVWELSIGALLSFYFFNNSNSNWDLNIRNIISFIGMSLILISIFFFNKDTPFPGLYALFPTVGAASIILCGQPDTYVGRLLSSKLLVYIGLISFSVYLWHQPVFSIYRYYFHEINTAIKFILIIIIFLISILSWRYVENFFRNRSLISRKYIFIFSVIFILTYAAFGMLSVRVFQSSEIHGGEVELARILKNNQAIYSSNMDERKFILSRIQLEQSRPDAIVLGSSRTMQLDAQSGAGSILNLSISGALLADDIVIADFAANRFKPDTIFVAADPWLLNDQAGQNYWNTLSDEFVSRLIRDNPGVLKRPLAQDGSNSFDAVLTSLGVSLYNYFNKQKIISDNNKPEIRDKILHDGSRIYNINYQNMTPELIERSFSHAFDYSMKPYVFSSENLNTFQQFINKYSKKFKIVLVLSPYHPAVYDRIKKEGSVFLEAEAQFRALAKHNNVQIIGSYDPAKAECKAADFFDGMHPKSSCMVRVIQELKVTP